MSGGRAFYANGRSGKAPRLVAQLNRFGAPWLVQSAAQSLFSLLFVSSSPFLNLFDSYLPFLFLFISSSLPKGRAGGAGAVDARAAAHPGEQLRHAARLLRCASSVCLLPSVSCLSSVSLLVSF